MQTKLELYEKVTPLARLGIWERNIVTGEIYWNSIIREIYEVSPGFNPETNNSLIFYKDKQALETLITLTVASGKPEVGEFLLECANGQEKWARLRMQAAYEDEKCTVIYGTLEDITQELSILNDLKENEKKFHQAFDNAPIGMALVSPTGQWIKINSSLRMLLGYEEEEFLQKTFQDFTWPDDLHNDLQLMNKLLDGKISTYNMEKRYIHKDGHLIWALLSVSLVRDKADKPLYFISQIKDVTDQRRYTEALKRERQRLDNIIKGTRVGTWEWNIETGKFIANKRAADILGYPFSEFSSGNILTMQNLIHPDDLPECERRLEQAFKKETKFYACECRMKHKEGHWLWVETRGKVIEWDAENKPLYMLGTFADIHERKTMEQERKRTLATISEQNDRLLNFAHIVSHNLRSHTGNIQMLTDMILEEEDPAEKEILLRMLNTNSVNLQETLVHLNDIIEVNGINQYIKKSLNLFEEIHKILETLTGSLRQAKVEVHLDVEPDINIDYNPAYLESILLNLISNCIKYRNPNRVPQINISAYPAGEVLVLEVSDNGLGIDLTMHGNKLFGMYKTFHNNSDARGLGLFLIKNQVEAMGGTITAESQQGVGTTFRVEIV